MLGSFHSVAVHDAWAPYDTYPYAAHQLCSRTQSGELASVAETTPAGQWSWATQTTDAPWSYND